MVQFLQLVVSGLAMGCVLGLIALGFTLIYKATETVNFAQGDLMMLGGFVALTAVAMVGLPFWLGVVAAVAVMALFGAGLERVALRPVLGQPAFAIVMVTIGIGFMMRGLVSMVPGLGHRDLHRPGALLRRGAAPRPASRSRPSSSRSSS